MKLNPEKKKFRPEWDSNPRPVRYRCSALTTELSSQPGAGWYCRGHGFESRSGLNLFSGFKGPLKYLVATLHGCHPNAISLPVSQNIFACFFRRQPVADSSRSWLFFLLRCNKHKKNFSFSFLLIANEPAERRRSAGEAAENSATWRMLYAEKFSIDLWKV